MVAEVNKIIAGELLNHRSVVIPGVGTLYVAHRGARRLSRQKIAAPRNEIDFRPSEEGVSLVELIRRAAGCDEAQAQAVFGRWLAKTREGEVLTLEGIGILRHRAFTSCLSSSRPSLRKYSKALRLPMGRPFNTTCEV